MASKPQQMPVQELIYLFIYQIVDSLACFPIVFFPEPHYRNIVHVQKSGKNFSQWVSTHCLLLWVTFNSICLITYHPPFHSSDTCVSILFFDAFPNFRHHCSFTSKQFSMCIINLSLAFVYCSLGEIYTQGNVYILSTLFYQL